MTVRTATPEDAEAIRTVAEDSWEQDYPNILSSESLTEGLDEWYAPDRIREAISQAHTRTLVAEQDGEVVGFVHGLWDVAKSEGDVFRLYVHPDYRSVGIGTDLLEAICRRLFDNGVDQIRAMVLEENDVGNEFYAAFGFEHEDTTEVTIGGESHRENTYVLEPDRMPGE